MNHRFYAIFIRNGRGTGNREMEWLDRDSKRRDSLAKLAKLLIKRWSVEISQVGNSPRVKYREVLNFWEGNIVEIWPRDRAGELSPSSSVSSPPLGGSYRKYVKNLGLGHFL